MLAVFSDLDGSLRDDLQGIPRVNLETLVELGNLGIVRILATGRSLYSARKVINNHFPIDYLVFSSGAGIIDWRQQRLLRSHSLSVENVACILSFLQESRLDFMLHGPVPNNHHFYYYQHSEQNLDFEHRLQLYADFAEPLNWQRRSEVSSGCIVIVPAELTVDLHVNFQQKLPDLSIIRATSPLDYQSGWLEIFPAEVSKSQAAEWLCFELGLSGHMAFGNDYNDLDLLHWADKAYVVSDAPQDLKTLFPIVGSAAEGGFSQAVQTWLQDLS